LSDATDAYSPLRTLAFVCNFLMGLMENPLYISTI
jgi:hypothetical protein